jgi:hypothetical protein
MRVLASTAHGVYQVDVDEEEVVGLDIGASLEARVRDEASSLVVEIVDGRPPLRASRDGGLTWEEVGGGLPSGRAVAVHPEQPELVVYAGRNRLFVSRDGGRFWHALLPELPEIDAVAWAS